MWETLSDSHYKCIFPEQGDNEALAAFPGEPGAVVNVGPVVTLFADRWVVG